VSSRRIATFDGALPERVSSNFSRLVSSGGGRLPHQASALALCTAPV